MKKTLCLSALCFVFTLPQFLFAQTAKEKYEKGAIYLYKTFWSWSYIKDGKPYKFKDLENEFTIEAPSKEEFELYKKEKNKSTILGTVGFILCGITGTAYALVSTLNQSSSNESVSNVVLIGGFIGSEGIILLAGAHSTKSYNHLQKAIWLHNEEVSAK